MADREAEGGPEPVTESCDGEVLPLEKARTLSKRSKDLETAVKHNSGARQSLTPFPFSVSSVLQRLLLLALDVGDERMALLAGLQSIAGRPGDTSM